MAAVLACGSGAVLSHRDAAALWGLLRPGNGLVHVTVPGDGGRRKRPGIALHRSPSLLPSETTRRHGIPLTKPARTVADLRRTAPPTQVRRAIRQTAVLGLDVGEDHDRTRSDLERRFLNLCRRHGLPTPQVNVAVEGYLVDFYWSEHKLIVEVDSWLYHRGRQAFNDDHARDATLGASDYRVIPVTDTQLDEQPAFVIKNLRRRL